MKKDLYWNFYIRLTLQQFLTLSLSTFINDENLADTLTGGALARLLSIVFTLVLSILPIAFFLIIWINRARILTGKLSETYNSLTEGFKLTTILAIEAQPFALMRILITSIALVKLRDYPGIQI